MALQDLSVPSPVPQGPSRSATGGRLCACWCQGWAEVLVRRPSGNMAWMTRLENRQLVSSEELPLPDLLSLIAPGTTMERLLRQVSTEGGGVGTAGRRRLIRFDCDGWMCESGCL